MPANRAPTNVGLALSVALNPKLQERNAMQAIYAIISPYTRYYVLPRLLDRLVEPDIFCWVQEDVCLIGEISCTG